VVFPVISIVPLFLLDLLWFPFSGMLRDWWDLDPGG